MKKMIQWQIFFLPAAHHRLSNTAHFWSSGLSPALRKERSVLTQEGVHSPFTPFTHFTIKPFTPFNHKRVCTSPNSPFCPAVKSQYRSLNAEFRGYEVGACKDGEQLASMLQTKSTNEWSAMDGFVCAATPTWALYGSHPQPYLQPHPPTHTPGPYAPTMPRRGPILAVKITPKP